MIGRVNEAYHLETEAKSCEFLEEGSGHQISKCYFPAYRHGNRAPYAAVSFASNSRGIVIQRVIRFN